MNERLKQIIMEKSMGNQKDFCTLVGWTPQYLNGLLKNGGIGLTPVKTILEAFTDIDARWLILGTGSMYGIDNEKRLRLQSYNRIEQIVTLEKYLPVFTEEESEMYSNLLLKGTLCTFTAEQLDSLNARLKEYKEPQDTIINQSMTESVCRRPK